jgi:hypothetical protein
MTEPQLIIQFKSNSHQTVRNFQYFASYVIEELAKVHVNISIEPILDGAVLFYENITGYRIFHQIRQDILNHLSEKERRYVIHQKPFELEIIAIKAVDITTEEWSKLIYERYKSVYSAIYIESKQNGIILQFKGN